MNDILKICLENGFLLDKEVLNLFSSLGQSDVLKLISVIKAGEFKERMINLSFLFKNLENFKKIGLNELFFDFFREKSSENKVDVVNNYVKMIFVPLFTQRKIGVKDFAAHFRSRYEKIRKIFEERLENLISIRKMGDQRGIYNIIVMILSKKVTKNKNLMIEVEDLSGKSIVIINQNKKELFEKAKGLMEDDVVAFNVSGNGEMLFANDFFYPDSALKEKKFGNIEEFAVFSGDFHIGSKMFLEKEVLNFISWVNGEFGNEKERKIGKKVRYLFLTGDNIDGVGRYPGQERFLIEKTSVEQYKKFEKLLKLIRKDVEIIICPGQHDSTWVGEPQPVISERWAGGLYKMGNVHLVPNPAVVEIGGVFKILMYHGASMNSFINEILEIRASGGHLNPTKIVREMLKRRHLAPLHGSVDYIPCEKGDLMVIGDVPDIIATADQHRAEVGEYNNILMVASSCWQSMTSFEEKVGNIPDPCKVPVFNMKTRDIKIFDFSGEVMKEVLDEAKI